jgi:hypothetical protein
MARQSRLEYDLPDTYECTCNEAPADCRCGDEPEPERDDSDEQYDRWRERFDDDGGRE